MDIQSDKKVNKTLVLNELDYDFFIIPGSLEDWQKITGTERGRYLAVDNGQQPLQSHLVFLKGG